MGKSEHDQQSLCWTYSKWADSNCYTDGRSSICGRHNSLRRLRIRWDEGNQNIRTHNFMMRGRQVIANFWALKIVASIKICLILHPGVDSTTAPYRIKDYHSTIKRMRQMY